jgi:hypothetical protein
VRALEDALAAAKVRASPARQRTHDLEHVNRRLEAALAALAEPTPSAAGEAPAE